MELCQDVVDGLALLKDQNRIPVEKVQEIASKVAATLTTNSELNSTDYVFDHMNNAAHKLLALSLATLFIEAARLNRTVAAEVTALKSALHDVEVSGDVVTLIADTYEKSGLRTSLNRRLKSVAMKKGHPAVVDADWRQELVIKTKNNQHSTQLSYLIRLRTDQFDKFGQNEVTFSCTLEQLQDLVGKVREASKIVENLVAVEK